MKKHSNLNWLQFQKNKSKLKKQHGGARLGFGRKTKSPKTIVTRVPEKYVDAIKALIKHLDDCELVDKNYNDVVSEKGFLRSLKDKPQQLTFTVSPIKK